MNALCQLAEFKINGINAYYEDFGTKEDTRPQEAEPYGCGNMQFIPKAADADVLEKYGIDEQEYITICDALQCLSFGRCGWCV